MFWGVEKASIATTKRVNVGAEERENKTGWDLDRRWFSGDSWGERRWWGDVFVGRSFSRLWRWLWELNHKKNPYPR